MCTRRLLKVETLETKQTPVKVSRDKCRNFGNHYDSLASVNPVLSARLESDERYFLPLLSVVTSTFAFIAERGGFRGFGSSVEQRRRAISNHE